MSNTLTLNFDAVEDTESDYDSHIIGLDMTEELADRLAHFEAFSKSQGVTITKEIEGSLDGKTQSLSMEVDQRGGFSLSCDKRMRKMWPLTINSSPHVSIHQVITAYYLAQRMNLSVGFAPRYSKKIFLFYEHAVNEERHADIVESISDEHSEDTFFSVHADHVVG